MAGGPAELGDGATGDEVREPDMGRGGHSVGDGDGEVGRGFRRRRARPDSGFLESPHCSVGELGEGPEGWQQLALRSPAPSSMPASDGGVGQAEKK